MKNRIKSFIKYYSCIIFPAIVCVTSLCFYTKENMFLFDEDKMSSLISIATEFIGILLTILTIYLAVPRNPIRTKQLVASKHQHIYLSNILTGIILSFLSITTWIFFNNAVLSVVFFMASVSNIVITIYYTFMLIKLLEQ